MEFDEELAQFAEQLRIDWARRPPLASLSFPEARAVAEQVRARWSSGGPQMHLIRNLTIATHAGEVLVRLYLPAASPEPGPAMVYLHGGGFVLFSIDTHDRLMREYAAAGGFAVIAIDYPLAPEARYPIALDQIGAVLDWLGDHADEIGIDARRIAIGGDSVGANFAFATCLRQRDAGAPMPRAILSNYAALSGTISDAAEAAHGGPGALLDRAEMVWFYAQYLADPAQAQEAYACPILADPTGLPPTLLIIPERDVLAEQSIAMADRLRAAGVDTSIRRYAGAPHSFLEAMSISRTARAGIADGASFIRDRLAQQS